MAVNGNATAIEIPVTLGLKTATEQIEFLRKLLNETMKPNTAAYNEISKLLDKAAQSATRLKGSMSDSFKSSAESKRFGNDLEKTFNMITDIVSTMRNVSDKNLLLSPEDTETAKELQRQMNSIVDQIDTIRSGKVGKIFEDSTIEDFKKVTELASQLGLDLSNMTFKQVAQAFGKEFADVGKQLDDTKKKAEQLKETLKSFQGTQKESTISDLLNATSGATKQSNLTTDQITIAKDKLKELYEQYQSFGEIKIGKINSSDSAETLVKSQMINVSAAIEEQSKKLREKMTQYGEVLAQLNQVQTEGLRNGRERAAVDQQVNDILAQIGLVAPERAGGIVRDWVEKVKGLVQDGYNQLYTDNIDLGFIQNEIYNKVSKIFENLNRNPEIANSVDFQKILVANLQARGINITPEIKAALAQSIKGAVPEDAIRTVVDAIANSLTGEMTAATSETERLAQSQNDLTQASNIVSAVEQQQAEKIKQLEEQVAALTQKVNELTAAQKENLNKKLDPNTEAIEHARQEYQKAIEAVRGYSNGLAQMEKRQKALSNVQAAVTRWMGFYQVLNLTRRAIDSMQKHIKELDTVMTQIAVVTTMTQSDLWGQIGKYSEIARQYGVAIKGVYEVSQIFYQQGLQTVDVMTLTEETLKMARIAGLDYATAADYMTTAIRGFKMEMQDASHVTDVYSALAAKTASNTQELATAISKTASSAEAVGSSFEATSAMIATMISVTRESATNIGTALKSVISRYGEMTSDPAKLVDSEGEEMSLNKVDRALKTVGITIQDVNGQFRDFDDVIYELAEKWNTIDKNAQRYIATVMAGNRQQSRFLALISNFDTYKEALSIAQNAEDTGTLQTLKTLDSLDAKLEQMRVSIQEFYTSSGLEQLYKNVVDGITNIINAANSLSKIGGKFPALALTLLFQVIAAIKNFATLMVSTIQVGLSKVKLSFNQTWDELKTQARERGREIGEEEARGQEEGRSKAAGKISSKKMGFTYLATAASMAGAALTVAGANKYGTSKTSGEDQSAALLTGGGAALQGLGTGLMAGLSTGNVLIGVIAGIAALIPGLISALEQGNVSTERQIELALKREEEAKNTALKSKGEFNDLDIARNKLKSLEDASYESAEAMQEYKDYMNQLADTYPNLIEQLEITGDRTISLAKIEEKLAEARQKAARDEVEKVEAEQDTAKASISLIQSVIKEANQIETDLSLSVSQAETTGIINRYVASVEKLIAKSNGAVSFEQLFEISKTNFDKLNLAEKLEKISGSKVIDGLNELLKYEEGIIDSYDEVLPQAKLSEAIAKKVSNNTEDYISFMEAMGNLELLPGNKNYEAIANKWNTFVKQNIHQMDEISSINFQQFKSTETLTQYLNKELNITDSSYVNTFVAKMLESISIAQENLKNSIQEYNYGGSRYSQIINVSDINSLMTDDEEKDEIDILTSQYYPLIQKQLSNIYKMEQNGQKQAATILYTHYIQFFEELSTKSDEIQTSLFGILSKIDWTDRDSLQKAIDSVEELGEGHEEFVELLQYAMDSLSLNAVTAIDSIVDGIKTLNKDLNTFLGKVTKGMSYDTAFEEAQKLISKDKDSSLEFDNLVEFDNTTKQWIFKVEGVKAGIEQLIGSSLEELEEANNMAAAQLALLDTNFQGDYEEIAKDYEYVSAESLKVWAEEQQQQGTSKEEIEKQIKDAQARGEEAIARIKQNFLTFIAQIDFSAIANGTLENEEYWFNILDLYLKAIGGENSGLTDTIKDALRQGDVTPLEEALEQLGIQNFFSDSFADAVKDSNFKQYRDILTELLSSGGKLSNESLEVLKNEVKGFENISENDNPIDIAIRLFSFLSDQYESLEEKQSDALKLFKSQNKAMAFDDLVSGTFDIESFADSIFNTLGKTFNEIFDTAENVFKGDLDSLNSVIEVNKITGEINLKAGVTLEDYLKKMAEIYGITLDTVNEATKETWLKPWRDKALKDIQEQDKKLKANNAIQSLTSATEGAYLAVDGFTDDVIKALEQVGMIKLDDNGNKFIHLDYGKTAEEGLKAAKEALEQQLKTAQPDEVASIKAQIKTIDTTLDTFVQNRINNKKSAITELINWNGQTKLSQGTLDALEDAGLSVVQSTNEAITSAIALYRTLNDTNSTIAERNAQALEIAKKQFNGGQGAALSSLVSGAITLDSLEAFATSVNREFGDFFNESLSSFTDEFEGMLEYDKFSGEIKVLASNEEFINKMAEIAGINLKKDSADYLAMYAQLTGTRIADAQKENLVQQTYNSIKQLSELQEGGYLDLSYMPEILKNALKGLKGIDIDDEKGLAYVQYGTEISDTLIELREILEQALYLATSDEEKAIIKKNIEELDEAYENIISSKASAVSEAINDVLTGKASRSTKNLLAKYGVELKGAATDVAVALLEQTRDLFHTIQEYNDAAYAIIENSLKQKGKGDYSGISSFVSNTITASSFKDLANNYNREVTDFIDYYGNIANDALKKVLTYNTFTGSYDITGSIEEFVQAISEELGYTIEQGSEDYIRLVNEITEQKVQKKIDDSIVKKQIDQINNVVNGQVGDIFNVSTLSNQAQQLLMQWGVAIEDGVATITKNFNVYEILKGLQNINVTGNDELELELTTLKDQLLETLQNWAGIISDGIKGNLNYTNQAELIKFATTNLGIDAKELTFEKTVDGLKLSTDSAVLLYTQLKKVDNLQAQIVFDELRKSLEDANSNYKTAGSLMAHIADLSRNINKINKEKQPEKYEQYKRELEVAKQILQVRSATEEDDSFKFMDNAIPAAQNNPLNYYANLKDAMDAVNTAFDATSKKGGKGYMDYTDWYNIIQHYSDMAVAAGKEIKVGGMTFKTDGTSAAQYILEGTKVLEQTDTGEFKVNLGKIGADLNFGAEDMAKGLDKGMETMAKGQIKMLDGMIAFLETVVAMENLDSDIDFGGSIFDASGKFTEAFTDWQKQIQTQLGPANKLTKETEKYLKGFKVDGVSLYNLIYGTADDLASEGEKAAQALTALRKLAGEKDINFQDLVNDPQKIAEALSKYYKGKGKIEINGRTYYKLKDGTTIDITKNKNGKITWNNNTYDGLNTEEFRRDYTKYSLEQAGAIFNGDTIEWDGKVATGYGTVTVGLQTLNVKSENGKLTYEIDGITGTTQEEAIQKWYKKQTGNTSSYKNDAAWMQEVGLTATTATIKTSVETVYDENTPDTIKTIFKKGGAEAILKVIANAEDAKTLQKIVDDINKAQLNIDMDMVGAAVDARVAELTAQQEEKLAAAQAANQEAQTNLANAQAQVQAAQDKVTELSAELEENEAKIIELKEELAELKSEDSSAAQQREELNKELAELTTKRGEIQTELDTAKEELAAAQANLETAQQQADSAREALSTTLSSIRDELDSMKSLYTSSEKTISSSANTVVNNINKALDKLEEIPENLVNTEFNDLDTKITELRGILGNIEEYTASQSAIAVAKALEGAKNELAEANNKLEAAKASAAQAQADLEAKQKDYDEALARYTALLADKKATEADIQEAQEALKAAQTALTEAQANKQSADEALASAQAAAQAALADVQTIIDQIPGMYDELQSTFGQNMTSKAEECKGIINDASTTLGEKVAALNSFLSSFKEAAANTALRVTKEQLQKRTDEYNDAESRFNAAQETVNDLQAQLKALEVRLNQAGENDVLRQDLEAQIAATKEELEQAEADLAIARTERDAAAEALRQAIEDANATQEQVNSLADTGKTGIATTLTEAGTAAQGVIQSATAAAVEELNALITKAEALLDKSNETPPIAPKEYDNSPVANDLRPIIPKQSPQNLYDFEEDPKGKIKTYSNFEKILSDYGDADSIAQFMEERGRDFLDKWFESNESLGTEEWVQAFRQYLVDKDDRQKAADEALQKEREEAERKAAEEKAAKEEAERKAAEEQAAKEEAERLAAEEKAAQESNVATPDKIWDKLEELTGDKIFNLINGNKYASNAIQELFQKYSGQDLGDETVLASLLKDYNDIKRDNVWNKIQELSGDNIIDIASGNQEISNAIYQLLEKYSQKDLADEDILQQLLKDYNTIKENNGQTKALNNAPVDEKNIKELQNLISKLENIKNNSDAWVKRMGEQAQTLNVNDFLSFDQLPGELQTEISSEDYNAIVNIMSTDNKSFKEALDDIIKQKRTLIVSIQTQYDTGDGEATGNVALAKGTLMGELGRELVVSHGRYFTVGDSGAEFVNLDKDAIVFNHLQTEKLLKNGKAGRGKPITNARNAVGMAAGNARASNAASTLAALKQLRGLWEGMLKASMQDIANKAGGGGGGGGDKNKNAGFIADLERWYNLLRQIEDCEKRITYQETLRSKIASDMNKNGAAYVQSLSEQYKILGTEIAANHQLAQEQAAYYEQRRQDLEKSEFGKIFTFDKDGLMQYNDTATLAGGQQGGLAALAKLNERESNGNAKYTAKEQYEMLKSWGFSEAMAYNDQGEKIDVTKDGGYSEAVQAFWDGVDAWKEELDELHDSVQDQLNNVLENEQKRNEILQEVRDNELDIEQKVLKAVEDSKQANIDNLQKTRDAFADAAQKYQDGLSEQLDREQKMYQKQEKNNDLAKLQRQLSILQRSGGSASQIAALQNQIRGAQQDAYFEQRQEQIDAIKEASDKQLEKMDQQIKLAQEQLDFQKQNGLLWKEVRDIMNGSPESIYNYITTHDSEWMSKSGLMTDEEGKQLKFAVDKFYEAYAKERMQDIDPEGKKWEAAETALKNTYKLNKKQTTAAQKAWEDEYARTADENLARQAAEKAATEAGAKKKTPETKKDSGGGKTGGNTGSNTPAYGTKPKSKSTVKYTYVCNGKTLKSGNFTWQPTGKNEDTSSLNANVPKKSITIKGKFYEYVSASPKTICDVHGGQVYNITYNYALKPGYVWKIPAIDDYIRETREGVNAKKTKEEAIKEGQSYLKTFLKQDNGHASSLWLSEAFDAVKHKVTAIPAYKEGGLIDYTGPALVHGSKSKPEGIFNAEQTKFLKDSVFNPDNPVNVFLSQFEDILANTANGNTYDTINRDQSLVIENATVNMNVASIANDYDARRAGASALDEMLKIARKAGGVGVSRR